MDFKFLDRSIPRIFFVKSVEAIFFCIQQIKFTLLHAAFTYSGVFYLAGFINNTLF